MGNPIITGFEFMYTIYKATNILNNKSYVGLDSKYPRRRYNHIARARTAAKYLFQQALCEYGSHNFQWEILFECEDHDLAVDAEIFYIKFFGSFGNFGYNNNAGGGGMAGKSHTKSTIEKISATKKLNPTKYWLGKKRDLSTKEKISQKHKNREQSNDHKRKNSAAIKLKWNDPVWREKNLKSRRKNNHVS